MSEHKEIGHVVSFFAGVAAIQGLPHVFLHEVLLDENRKPAALAIGFDENFVEALFFDESFNPEKVVFRSFKSFKIPTSDSYLGRLVDGLGVPQDELGRIQGTPTPVFRPAPPIIDRAPITTPLSTGIKVIDTSLPLGRGQRELIVGDRKLGKSTLAVDTVLNQKHADPPVRCVYVVCGQTEQKLRELVSVFNKNNTWLYTTVVAATAKSSFAQQYLAPFVGTTIAEHFRDQGQDALIVYDDLSKHAKAYRDISLLTRRAPGREAYPGDIFSLHAALLERAAQLAQEKGGGSLTALPIIETQEGDITSFIPTNLISITDGQIYLEHGLYQKGFLPAVNVGLSVSRVGSQAQPPTLREVIGSIRLALAQNKELQKLTQLETVVNKETQKKIRRGELTLELLKQSKHTNVSWPEQVVLFYTVEKGFFDDIERDEWAKFETLLLEMVRNRYPDILETISQEEFGDKERKRITELVSDFKGEFASSKG
jgi:F-type H+-transporting ATPase subunit alpha